MTTGAYTVLLVLMDRAKGNRIITGKEIGELCGLKPAEVRAEVNNLRCGGFPVCANGRGYYLSADKKEVRRNIKSLQHRIQAIQNAVDGLYKALNRIVEVEE